MIHFKNKIRLFTRAFCTTNIKENFDFISAINFRIHDILNKLQLDINIHNGFLKKVVFSAKLLHANDPFAFKDEEQALGEKTSAICEKMLLKKAGSSSGLMYSEEYQINFMPSQSVLEIEMDMLLSKKHQVKGFERLRSNLFEMQLRDGENPSDCLEAFLEGPTITDCGSTTEALFFKVLKDEIKEDRFNALFSRNDLKLRFTHNGVINQNSIINLFTKQLPKLEVGARCYFHGHREYTKKHGNGIGLGLHAILMKDQTTFYGLGLKKPLNALEVIDYLRHQYNKEPRENMLHFVNEHFKIKYEPKENEEDDLRLSTCQHMDRLSSEIISYLIKSTTEKIKSPGFRENLLILNAFIQTKALIEDRNEKKSMLK